MNSAVLAIDIGASSGRHMLGQIENGKLTLEEIYRFPNGAVKKNGRLCWDHQALWEHILTGMKKCVELGRIPASVGVDTWGVDYVLVDEDGRMLSDGIAYRDDRTQAVLDKLSDEELYRQTGIARQPFNTVYQLMTEPKELLQKAHRLLFTPDYFHFLLSGKMVNEYTIASTGALLNPADRTWDKEVLHMAGIPQTLFPEAPKMPGTILGRLRPEVAAEVGFDCSVILPASHDTGSAYMAVPARDGQAAYLSSGTWSLLGTELDGPVVTEKARLSGFTNEGGYQGKIRLLRNIMGLWMLQCIRRELNGQYSFAEMAEMALQGAAYPCTVDAMDNRFLAPENMTAEIKAALREAGSPEPASLPELLACVNRSLAKCYADGIRELSILTGKTYTSLNIVGGGCNNRVLNQWTADATGLPVFAGPGEGTALGNAIAQMIALGELKDLSHAREHIRADFELKTFLPKEK
mgnify:CR=1 FL=1